MIALGMGALERLATEGGARRAFRIAELRQESGGRSARRLGDAAQRTQKPGRSLVIAVVAREE